MRALPVLVVAGSGAIAALSRIWPTPRSPSTRTSRRIEDFEDRTVAVFNRGVPSFAVDSDGTLHTSLMRSCTGWPSGTWIDPPRRTAPDGSNFQLQHWTHAFDYAVVSGGGDWRDAGIPSRSAEFGQPLLVGDRRDHDFATGGLPPWGSLLEVEPARRRRARRAQGGRQPDGRGQRATSRRRDGIALRLVETRGRTTDVVDQLGSAQRDGTAASRPARAAARADDDRGLRLHGYEIATFGIELNLPRVLDADGAALAPDAEPAQPLYARYWLHNRGPAPLGGLPAVAHLHPHQLAVDADAPVRVHLTAASDATDESLHGRVRLVCPPGWTVAPDDLPFVLPPGGYLESALDVVMPPGTAPGLYPLRAELGITGSGLPPAWRQVVEDVCVIAVGATDDRVLRLVRGPRTRRRRGGSAGDQLRHRGHRRVDRPRRGGASDQPLGNLGVVGPQHRRG